MFNKLLKFKVFIGESAWKFFWITVVTGPAWFAVESLFVYIMQGFLYSIGLLTREQTFLPDWYPTSLMASVAFLITFGLLRAVVTILKIHFSNLTLVSFNCHQRKSLLAYGLNNAELISSREIVSIFTETTTLAGSVILNLALLITVCVSSLLMFVMGLRLAPMEMIIGITLLGVFLYPMKYTMKMIDQYGKGLLLEWEGLGASLLQGLKNNFFLKIYHRVDAEIKVGNASLAKYQQHYRKYSWLAGFSNIFPMLIGIIVLSIITYCSVAFIHTDSMKLISFFYIFVRLAQAASEISTTLASFKLNLPGLTKLYEWQLKYVQDVSYKESIKRDIIVLSSKEFEVVAQELSFAYNIRQTLFNNLNFSLRKSDVLVIKGESGTGKSTLLSIILGINTPTSGKVFLNGIDVREKLVDLQQIMAYVGPEAYLIQGTVKENLLYGLDNPGAVTDKEIWSVLELMQLKDLIERLPLRLSEPLGDIAQLSTGQKQRLSFARALIRKPSFLILDEATANLDSFTEKKIIENLNDLFKNCTSIIVTHKDSFDSIATQQIRLGA